MGLLLLWEWREWEFLSMGEYYFLTPIKKSEVRVLNPHLKN